MKEFSFICSIFLETEERARVSLSMQNINAIIEIFLILGFHFWTTAQAGTFIRLTIMEHYLVKLYV